MQDNIRIKSVTVSNLDQKIFWVLVSLVVCMLAVYVYFVQSTIVSVVERKTAETEIRDSQSKIGELEAELNSLARGVDSNFASEMGYREISKIDYVSRTPILTMRD